ncbi:Detected protein of confused Function [Hibiscus syriacus]|uniref:Detected protein of confused Function n=1 Tax=Hibiscus syriacus TaxID=106335 RepID=A0A6A2ZBF6_HIBSY|nr:Detected protein of confused Function [Hibiscus syriacus]
MQCGRSAKPLIVTGHSLGGSVASLFTLWLLEGLDISKEKRPLCLTFGSPLLGDKGFQQAISEHPAWHSCFLHVAATSKDSIPRLFIAPSHYLNSAIEASKYDHYKPFDAANEEQMIDVYGRIVEQLESVIIRKGSSQLSKPMLSSLQAGTTLQLEAIRIQKEQNHQQKGNELDNLIKKLEELEVTCLLNKRKNRSARSDHDIIKHKKFLTTNWGKIVAQAEKKPQNNWFTFDHGGCIRYDLSENDRAARYSGLLPKWRKELYD